MWNALLPAVPLLHLLDNKLFKPNLALDYI